MIVSMIVAMTNNRIIGKNNKMPWGHLPIDLKHFKKITNNKIVIMGRKTYDSIGKPLPNRINIVLSKNKELKIQGVYVVDTIVKAFEIAELTKIKELFIIGGGNIYNKMIDKIDKLYLTIIDVEMEGDTFFPEIKDLNFVEINGEYIEKDEINKYNCTFIELEKVK